MQSTCFLGKQNVSCLRDLCTRAAVDLHEHTSTRQITKIYREPTNPFKNLPSHIILERGCCVAAVIRRAWAQTTALLSIFTSKMKKWARFLSLQLLIHPNEGRQTSATYIKSLCVYITEVLCPYATFFGVGCRSGPWFGVKFSSKKSHHRSPRALRQASKHQDWTKTCETFHQLANLYSALAKMIIHCG